MKKDIDAQKATTKKAGRTAMFQTKMQQAVDMLICVANQFIGTPILVVTDSWFGNDGLYRPLSQSEFEFHLLSRLRANITLYDLPPTRLPHQRGATRKYGARLGNASDLATLFRNKARVVAVFLYGKQREVIAYDQVVMLKNLRYQVRIVWVFRKIR